MVPNPKRASQQKRTKRVTNPPPNPRPQQCPRRHKQPQVPDLPGIPDELIERVFAFLPVKQAINAGTVAKTYARSWSLSRHLVFDMNYLAFRPHKLIQIVDGVIDSHKGPEILTFALFMDPHGVESSNIERWLRFCIQKGLQNLDLRFFIPFTLGAEFLDIPTLRTLKLNNCTVQLPTSFKPLQFLHTIFLRRIQLEEGVIQLLVFYSEMLGYLEIVQCTGFRNVYFYAKEHRHFKTLKIYSCDEVERIAIDAPTLKSFFYYGHVPIIRMVSVTPLDEAFVQFVPRRNHLVRPYDMEILVSGLFHVRVLTITAPFIEALAARVHGAIYRDAVFVLANVKELQLFMEGGIFCNPFDIALFIKHCPNLETLFIDMNGHSFDCGGAYWQMHQKPCLDIFNHYYSRLKFVKLLGFKFLGPNIELVKILLQRSTILEALFLVAPKSGRGKYYPSDPTKYNQLFQSWKVASAARIVLYEHRYDCSSLDPTHNIFNTDLVLCRV